MVMGVAEVSKHRAKENMPKTLEAWMPTKVELKKNGIFTVEEKEQIIGAMKAEEESEVARVTVDSGAAKSVWPRSKQGVLRRKLAPKTKLVAANGTKIEVFGEVLVEFENDGRQCGMRFLDSHVRNPLGVGGDDERRGELSRFEQEVGELH